MRALASGNENNFFVLSSIFIGEFIKFQGSKPCKETNLKIITQKLKIMDQETLTDLIKVTEFKKDNSTTLSDLNYYGQILDLLNKL